MKIMSILVTVLVALAVLAGAGSPAFAQEEGEANAQEEGEANAQEEGEANAQEEGEANAQEEGEANAQEEVADVQEEVADVQEEGGADVQEEGEAESQEEDGADVMIVSMDVAPEAPTPGDTITVDATLVNFGSVTSEELLELRANGTVVDTFTVSLTPRENKDVRFSFDVDVPGDVVIVLGGVTREVRVVEPDQPVMRVGPSVRLDVRQDIITEQQDALIDLFWDNSALNEQAVNIELKVDVPSGLYLYSQDGAMACAAGSCKGLFTALPGDVRNMPITVKADRVGEYFVHMNGRYWPEECPDCWNPISLSKGLTVRGASSDTGPPKAPVPGAAAAPAPTPGSTSEPPPSPETCDDWWRCPSAAQIALMALAALAAVALAAIWAIPRALKAGRPKIDIG